MNDIATDTLVLLVTAALAFAHARRLGLSWGLSSAMFLWHTALCVAYWWQVSLTPADANHYYEFGRYGYVELAPGTKFVRSIAVLLVGDMGLSFLGTFLVFNLFGVMALQLFAATLLDLRKRMKPALQRLSILLVFSPLLNFWSSALGKDAIAAWGINLAVHASLDVGRRWQSLAAGVVVVFCVRPHVALFLLVGVLIASATGTRVSLSQRTIGLLLSASIAAATVPFVQTYVGLGEVDATEDLGDYQDAVVSFLERRQGHNLRGGSSVEISELSLPMQLFTFMFRPLFFDAPNVLGQIASVENALLLLMVLLFVPGLGATLRANHSFFVRFNLSYFLLAWVALATTTANLGIAVRQKTMLLPSLMLLCAVGAARAIGAANTESANADLETQPAPSVLYKSNGRG